MMIVTYKYVVRVNVGLKKNEMLSNNVHTILSEDSQAY